MESKSLESIIGTNIVKYREKAGMTQAKLAECIGISTAFISRVERGQKMMKVHTLYATAQALNVSCDALLSLDEPTAQFENIKRFLKDQPSEYLEGIEQIIRTCVEKFGPKEKTSSNCDIM